MLTLCCPPFEVIIKISDGIRGDDDMYRGTDKGEKRIRCLLRKI